MASKSNNTGLLLLFGITFVFNLVSQGDAFTCAACNKSLCQSTSGCKYGLSLDPCLCCKVCAKGPNQPCGGLFNTNGICASDLTCFGDSKDDFYPGRCLCPADVDSSTLNPI